MICSKNVLWPFVVVQVFEGVAEPTALYQLQFLSCRKCRAPVLPCAFCHGPVMA